VPAYPPCWLRGLQMTTHGAGRRRCATTRPVWTACAGVGARTAAGRCGAFCLIEEVAPPRRAMRRPCADAAARAGRGGTRHARRRRRARESPHHLAHVRGSQRQRVGGDRRGGSRCCHAIEKRGERVFSAAVGLQRAVLLLWCVFFLSRYSGSVSKIRLKP